MSGSNRALSFLSMATDELTREDLEAEADALAREVLGSGASRADAWDRVRAGDYEGTFFAARIGQIYWLLGEDPGPILHAAE